MTARPKFKTVDEFIFSFEGPTRERLEELRALIQQTIPDATERISYNIPAKKICVHVGAYFLV